jgi:hypothetical protein
LGNGYSAHPVIWRYHDFVRSCMQACFIGNTSAG